MNAMKKLAFVKFAAVSSCYSPTQPFNYTKYLEHLVQYSYRMSKRFTVWHPHAFNTYRYHDNSFDSQRNAFFSTLKNSRHENNLPEQNSFKRKDDCNVSNSNSSKTIRLGIIFFGISIGSAFLLFLYEVNKSHYDADGKLIKDEFSHLSYPHQLYNRLKKELTYYKKLVQEPSRDKLLPDPIKHPYVQPPYTVILELTDVLVHPDWTYQTGWRFKKRPGVDYFLDAIASPLFEVVVYTAEQGFAVSPILDALDSNNNITYRLFRDATRFVDGHHIKDLDAVNRDLRKVIVIDWNPESVKFHPENMLQIPRWNGNDHDTALYDLAVFLKTVYATNVEDVREVLSYYRQFENPLEIFRGNQRKLLEQLENEGKRVQKEDNKLLGSRWTPFFLRK